MQHPVRRETLKCFSTETALVAPDEPQDVSWLEPLEKEPAEVGYGLTAEQLRQPLWLVPPRACPMENAYNVTCFVNASMQVLLRVSPFVRMIQRHGHDGAAIQGCRLCALSELAVAVAQGDRVSLSGVAALVREGGFGRDFKRGQQDAMEFLLAAIKGLSDHESRHSDLQWYGHRQALQEHVWGGVCRTRSYCTGCSYASDCVTHRVYLDLDLPSGPVEKCSLQALLELYFSQQVVFGWDCARKKCVGRKLRQEFLEREPALLMLKLGRGYEQRMNGQLVREGRKNVCVEFPEVLRCLRSGPYALRAILRHRPDAGAGVHSGHYLATCWAGSSRGISSYTELDDNRVTTGLPWVSVSTRVVQQEAYVLVYERECFWGDDVGDGVERTPWARDSHTVEVAETVFWESRRAVAGRADGAEAEGGEALQGASGSNLRRPRPVESSGAAGGVNATPTGSPAAKRLRVSVCDKEVVEVSAGQSAADSPGVQSPAAKCPRCAPEGRALPGADLSGLVPTFSFGSADGSTVTVRAREMPGADSSRVASRDEVSGAQGRGGAGPVARRRARGAAGSTAGRGRVGGERLVGAARAADMGTWAQEQPSGGDAGETRRRSQRLAAARACEEVPGAGGNATPQSRGRGGDDRRGRGRRSAPYDHGGI